MRPACLRHIIATLLALALTTSLWARGQFWNFLGYTQLDSARDHGRVQVMRHHLRFRTIQLRVSGQAFFFDRIVFYFGNGSTEELIVGDRLSPQGKNYLIDLPGERGSLESVELWYYKEPWEHSPKVSVYGIPLPDPDAEAMARVP